MIAINVAIYDTEINGRIKYTRECVKSLLETVNPETSRIVLINNNSCQETFDFINETHPKHEHMFAIHNNQNRGTAEAINSGIKYFSQPGDYVIKLDNDVTFDSSCWADEMVECFEADQSLGVLGLKRKDLPNSPDSKEYPTVMETLENGRVIELCGDIIGTCHMYSPKLIEKVGYLWQPGLYGGDDVLMCHRSILAGFRNAFYPSVGINHIDEGGDFYTEWKRKYAGTQMKFYNEAIRGYNEGTKNLYYDPFSK